MNQKAKSVFANISRAVSVNILRLLISVVLTLLLPKVLGVEAFSYWQLYLFYSIYAAFSSLGWCEGVYLTYGGMNYEDLPRQKIASQFRGLLLYEIVFSIVAIAVFTSMTNNPQKKMVITLVFITTCFEILRYSLQCTLQTTNRIKDYARLAAAERVLFFGLVILCLVLGLNNFVFIILCETTSKFVGLIYVTYVCRDIVFVKNVTISKIIIESKKMISIGFKMLCAILASQLILGIVRFAIENKWGTIAFGRISLTLSFANMIITAISAISIVIFPILKQMDREKSKDFYAVVRTNLLLPLLFVLNFYPVIFMLLKWWLPQYADSLKYLAILLPLCIYESRNLILTDTYFKAYRKTELVLMINIATIAMSATFTAISVYIMESVDFAVISIVLLLFFKSLLSEIILNRYTNQFYLPDIFAEAALCAVYIYSNWFLNHGLSAVIYPLTFIMYLLIKRKKFVELLKEARSVFGES